VPEPTAVARRGNQEFTGSAYRRDPDHHSQRGGRVLDFPGTKNDPSKIALRSRDFSVRHVLDGWDYEEPHVLLGPTRHEVWNRYLSHPKLADKPELLSHVFDAIVSELKARDIAPPALSLAELNRRLMKALEQEFEKPL